MTAKTDGWRQQIEGKVNVDVRCGDCGKWKNALGICGNTRSDHYAHRLSPVHPACRFFTEEKED